MKAPSLHARRIGPTLIPDRSRVLLRPFRPSTAEIAARIVARVMTVPETQVRELLEVILGEFGNRHEEIKEFFRNRFSQVRHYVGAQPLSENRQALIGAYFTHEYSPESAALFNPSIVPHPDQTGLPAGALRFILSLRATGEGHISSITFREGTVSAQHRIILTPPVALATEPARIPNVTYDKPLFARKLRELGVEDAFAGHVLDQLGVSFTMDDIRRVLALQNTGTGPVDAIADRASRGILLLAESNYEVRFNVEHPVSQRVIFPATPSQSNGIEDARFVRFQNDDGSFT